MNGTYRNRKTGELYRISQDAYPDSPREWDNLGTMVTWHRGYALGDRQPLASEDEWMVELARELMRNDPLTLATDFDNKLEDYLETIGRDDADDIVEKRAVALPLYLYDHGGITMRTTPFGCRWDSGQVGWIYVSETDARKEWGDEWREKAKACLEAEVEAYDDYLTGNVYMYETEGGDACGGFYPSHGDATDLRNAADFLGVKEADLERVGDEDDFEALVAAKKEKDDEESGMVHGPGGVVRRGTGPAFATLAPRRGNGN